MVGDLLIALRRLSCTFWSTHLLLYCFFCRYHTTCWQVEVDSGDRYVRGSIYFKILILLASSVFELSFGVERITLLSHVCFDHHERLHRSGCAVLALRFERHHERRQRVELNNESMGIAQAWPEGQLLTFLP